MKKILLTFSLIGFSVITVSAQITITKADIAVPSKIMYLANDTFPTISVGTAGASQTWNMAALQNNKADTMTFMMADWTANAAFPTANLVAKQGYQNNFAYMINSVSSLSTIGNAGTVDFGTGPISAKQFNSPAEIIMNFPATYNTTFNNDHVLNTPPFYLGITYSGIFVDSGRSVSTITKNVIVDGWGSITTPLGTYNVIRSKETVIKHDTSDAFVSLFGGWQLGLIKSADSTTSYVWWANSIGFPIATATMDSAGNVKNVQWLLSLPVAGINEIVQTNNTLVFPNPAQNNVSILTDDKNANFVEVFDISGRKINAYPIENKISVLNTSEYANGLYTFSIVGKNNNVISRGRFTIAK